MSIYDERYEQFYLDAESSPDVIRYISTVARPDLQVIALEEGICVTDVEGWQEALDDYCEAEYYELYNGR
tara:strand:+ start:500 stop:709 length:210 start_codon:yes stop_codon:yes gene_type:complete